MPAACYTRILACTRNVPVEGDENLVVLRPRPDRDGTRDFLDHGEIDGPLPARALYFVAAQGILLGARDTDGHAERDGARASFRPKQHPAGKGVLDDHP